MKKLLFTFAILGLFVFLVPKNANSQEISEFPGIEYICGHTCWCDDEIDFMNWEQIYCDMESPE